MGRLGLIVTLLAALAASAQAAPKKPAAGASSARKGPAKPPPTKAAPEPAATAKTTPAPSSANASLKMMGVVSLRLADSDGRFERQANAQLRATAMEIAKSPLAEVTLPPDTPPADPEKLREYASSADLERVIGGEITTEGAERAVHLVVVSADGRAPIHVHRRVRDLSLEELVATVEDGTCGVLARAGMGDDCAGSIVIAGDAPGAKVVMDGVTVGTLPLPKPIAASVGAHDVILEREGATGAQTRVYAHLKSAVTLDVADVCNTLYFLQPGQVPECNPPIVLVEEGAKIRWKGIVTAAAGVAVVTAGALLGLRANARADDLNSAYAGAGLTRDALGTLQGVRSDALGANVMTGVGAALLAAGVTFYVLDF